VTATGQPQKKARCRPFQPGRVPPALLLLLLAFIPVHLTSCTTPTRAPVASRERPMHAVPPDQRPAYYQVRKGDTLYAISWRFGVDYRVIARWNRIRYPYLIYPGQSLRLSPPPASRQRQKKATVNKKKAPVKSPAVAKKAGSAGREPAPGAAGAATKPRQRSRPASAAKRQKNSQPAPAGKLSWQWPTKGRVQQSYATPDGSRKGIQIAGESGQAVVAAEAGKVVYAGSGLIGYGRLIIVKHNKNYLSAYGHNRKLLVREGGVVTKGQPVAEMGSNGTGEPMLHFEIRRNGKPVDPLKLLPPRRL
jgi:lipoprotein NlpD